MRAHTITTKARVGGRGHTKRTIVPRGILALSLAVVLVAATASTASTTPTPPAPPLTLGMAFKDGYNPDYPGYPVGPGPNGVVRNPLPLTKKLSFRATTSNDSTLVASGDVKRTTKQLAAGEGTAIKAKFKQPKWRQFKEKLDAPKPVRLHAKIKVKATDEFGQTATDKFKLKFWTR